MSGSRRPARESPCFVPFAGMFAGLVAGMTYWLGAQLWPSNVAVALAMAAAVAATTVLTGTSRPGALPPLPLGAVFWVFTLLLKYNALMALTAASGPFPLPPHLTLGLILIAGHAAAGGLIVSLLAGGAGGGSRVSALELSIALVAAFAPATLLGIPGLAGLVAAIVLRLLLTGLILPRLSLEPGQRWDLTQQLTEVSFYLGALATWRYV